MAKRRKPIQKLAEELERKERELIRAQNAWQKARKALQRMSARLDKQFAGNADVAELAEARHGARVKLDDIEELRRRK